jgi:hypothetical protein
MGIRLVALAGLVAGTSAGLLAQQRATMVTPTKGPATLRKCPEPKCPVVGHLPEGETVLVMNQERAWYWLDVPKEFRDAGEFSTTAWVRMEDVRAVTAPAAPTVEAAAVRHEPTPAVRPTVIVRAVRSEESTCLACAATKDLKGEITLTIEGEPVGGPGAGDPHFEDNMAMAQAKLGPMLAAAAKVADSARADLNKYLSACYGRFTRHNVHAGAAAGARTDSAAVAAVGNGNGSWAAVATASSSYAWRESWVEGVDVSNETTAYCRGLWSDVQDQAGIVRRASADIKGEARALEVWPLVIHRLLAQYGLK